jgi:integrase
MLLNGIEVLCPEGHYELRLYKGKTPVFRNVGNEPAEALAARDKEQKLVELRNSGVDVPETKQRKTLHQLKDKFLEKYAHGSADCIQVYTVVANEFVKVCNRTYPEQIEDMDVIRYCRGLEARGLAERTRANRYVTLRCFLRFCGIDPNKLISDPDHKKLKKFTKTEVETYTQEELDALIAATESPRHKLLWEFAYKTGFRYQECKYLEWADIDFKHKTVSVRRKPHWSFEPKDAEERTVPLVNGLGDKFQEWRKLNPTTRLVFGSRSDRPDNHFLGYLKVVAREAGLNCDNCSACKERKECEKFFLHKFRATYATRVLSKTDVRTVMKLMGHSDLASTMRYLQPARGEVVQAAVNAAFD